MPPRTEGALSSKPVNVDEGREEKLLLSWKITAL
jgi:hypothetical protein